MTDHLSTYRVIRVAIHLPATEEGEAHWTLTPLTVRKGVPNGTVTHRGVLPNLGTSPCAEMIAAALYRIGEEVDPA